MSHLLSIHTSSVSEYTCSCTDSVHACVAIARRAKGWMSRDMPQVCVRADG